MFFFSISPIFEIFDRFFWLLAYYWASPPPEIPDSPRVPHCRFILKIGKKNLEKIGFPTPTPQKRISDS